MHSKSDNMEIMTYDNPDGIIKELFDLLLSKHQIGLETQMRGSDFILDCVSLLYYKCHKINFKLGGSHIDSPDYKKRKKQQQILKMMMINVFNIQQNLH